MSVVIARHSTFDCHNSGRLGAHTPEFYSSSRFGWELFLTIDVELNYQFALLIKKPPHFPASFAALVFLREIVTKSDVVFLDAVEYDLESTHTNHPLKTMVAVLTFEQILLKEVRKLLQSGN